MCKPRCATYFTDVKHTKVSANTHRNMTYPPYPLLVGVTEEEWDYCNKHSYLGMGRMRVGGEKGT